MKSKGTAASGGAQGDEEDAYAESDDESLVVSNDEDVVIVRTIAISVSVVVVVLTILLIIYFFSMRNYTVKIKKHLLVSLRKRLVTSETSNQSPSKTLSLISFDRFSPEKVMPVNYTENENEQLEQSVQPSGRAAGSLLQMVKIQ